jgi:hypothetical protein
MDIRITGIDPAGFNISTGDGLVVGSATLTEFVVVKTDPGATYVSGGTAHAKEEVNPDLGFAGGYYDTGYAHAGLFRDASDGKFKFFTGYTPEPDEAVNIDTTDPSFTLADIVANSAEFTEDVSLSNINISGSIINGNSNIDINNSSQIDILSKNSDESEYFKLTVSPTSVSIDHVDSSRVFAIGYNGLILNAEWNGDPIGYQYGGTGLTTLGTAGQVLTVNSGATAIEWATPSGGGGGGLSTTTTSITTNSATAIESFAVSTSRTAEAIIQITQGTDYYSSKALLIHDGTNVKITEYAILESTVGAIPITISSAINGSNVELLATITDAATTNATAKVVLIEVAV